ncbi:hypothetical protein COCOBI_17-1650 [Coccomyxa sp. Obi]|nr:hypothetical protein COCOBI_17-1650 [Coccomyxa sp. Obi]
MSGWESRLPASPASTTPSSSSTKLSEATQDFSTGSTKGELLHTSTHLNSLHTVPAKDGNLISDSAKAVDEQPRHVLRAG